VLLCGEPLCNKGGVHGVVVVLYLDEYYMLDMMDKLNRCCLPSYSGFVNGLSLS